MRTICLVILVVALSFGLLHGQDQPGRQRRQLQQQVMQRLLQNGRAQAALTDGQFDRYQEIARRGMARRNEVRRLEMESWRALEGQMRPGVAADEDSVTALIDSLILIPEHLIEVARVEQQEYSEFLTPVQRAQLLLTHRRFDNNIRQIMQRRNPNRPGQNNRTP